MQLRVEVERREDDREDRLDIVRHEVEDVFVVPVVQRSFRDLSRESAMISELLHSGIRGYHLNLNIQMLRLSFLHVTFDCVRNFRHTVALPYAERCREARLTWKCSELIHLAN